MKISVREVSQGSWDGHLWTGRKQVRAEGEVEAFSAEASADFMRTSDTRTILQGCPELKHRGQAVGHLCASPWRGVPWGTAAFFTEVLMVKACQQVNTLSSWEGHF